MKIRRLEIGAFGRFRNLSLDLGPGLNVVYGSNEAGKSTLLRFIQGMLYGLQKPGAPRRTPLLELQRLMPWDGMPARGALVYATSDGRSYRVEREFGNRGFTRLYDAATGEELTSRYPPDQRKELLFAEAQLGLSDGEFAATACIGQMEAKSIGMSQELTTRLANLTAGGQEDLSLTGVLKLLSDGLSEIGAPGRESTKPLAEAVRRVQRLEAALDSARRVRDENLGKERLLRELRAEAARLSREIEDLRRWRDALRRHELRQRRTQLTELRHRLAEADTRAQALAAHAGFPAEHRDEVAALADVLTRLGRQEKEAAAELERLARQQAGAEQALAGFAPLQALDPDAEVQVSQDFVAYSRNLQDKEERRARLDELGRQLAAIETRLNALGALATEGLAWEARLEQLDEQVRQGESQLNRLGQARPDLQAQRESAERQLKGRHTSAALAAAGLAVVAAALAFALGQSLLAGLAVLALPVWLLLRRPSGAALQAHRSAQQALDEHNHSVRGLEAEVAACQAEKAGILKQAGASTMAEFKAKVREGQGLLQERERGLSESARLQTDVTHIDASLRVLGSALVEAVAAGQQVAATRQDAAAAALPDVLALGEAHVRQFRQVWAAYRRAREEVAELGRQRRQAENALADRRREREEAGQRLQDLLQQAGAENLQAYEESYRHHQEYRSALQARGTAEQVLQAALAEGDETALDRELSALGPAPAGEDEPLGAPSGKPAGTAAVTPSDPDVQELTRRLNLLTAELSSKQADARGLEGQTEQAYRGLDLAALEVELEGAVAERQALEDRRWVLEQAKTEIEAASEEVHREFAPRLNQVASAAIARITGGRYQDVRADKSLALRVLVPETGQLRPVEDLSGGSLDQFYLALRLGMADLLTGGREPVPFLLDDTFVQFDDQRLARVMDYLLELAQTNQALLFTCHRREAEAARRYPDQARILELPTPNAPSQG